jgi:hypothetical protein
LLRPDTITGQSITGKSHFREPARDLPRHFGAFRPVTGALPTLWLRLDSS